MAGGHSAFTLTKRTCSLFSPSGRSAYPMSVRPPFTQDAEVLADVVDPEHIVGNGSVGTTLQSNIKGFACKSASVSCVNLATKRLSFWRSLSSSLHHPKKNHLYLYSDHFFLLFAVERGQRHELDLLRLLQEFVRLRTPGWRGTFLFSSSETHQTNWRSG